ncbi:hypothetical protein F5Y19DRAFT_453513 [Xylariaceae sp. FL1651]|nr:hypothetical protein F5Y19DRAFT_453513 [Xylariaceae sp. FL1651]
MTYNKEGDEGVIDPSLLDPSLIDPRLRSDSPETPHNENPVLPYSPFTSLDHRIDMENVEDGSRLWLMGIQLGIGLGIVSTREAILNEMQNEGTVFSRKVTLDESDEDRFDMRMKIGQLCVDGFDLRVAYRAASKFLESRDYIASVVVQHGLTSALPSTGNAVIGTSTSFSEDAEARCHQNSQTLDNILGISDNLTPPDLQVDGGFEPQVPMKASYLVGGASIGGIDMTNLDGAAALIANALNANMAALNANHSAPVLSSSQCLGGQPGATEADMTHLPGDVPISDYLYQGNSHVRHVQSPPEIQAAVLTEPCIRMTPILPKKTRRSPPTSPRLNVLRLRLETRRAA